MRESMHNSGNNCLHIDVMKRDVKGLLKHLAEGYDPDFQNFDGDTPLIAACKLEDTKFAKLLISFGADLNKCDKQGDSALHISAHHINLNLFILLLTSGSDYCMRNNEGVTAFEILLEKIPKSEIKDNFRRANMYSFYKKILRYYDEHRQRKFWLGPRPIIKENKALVKPLRKIFREDISNTFVGVPIFEYDDLRASNISPGVSFSGNYFVIKDKIWKGIPISTRSVPIRFMDRFSRHSSSSDIATHYTEREIYWLSRLKHPSILMLLGVSSSSLNCGTPVLVLERIYGGCLHAMVHNKALNRVIPNPFDIFKIDIMTRLTILRQIIEALIYLKHLGVVHTTISSKVIYLIDMDNARLANFEHALLYPIKENFSYQKLSKDEISDFAPWLSSEVVLYSQTEGKSASAPRNRVDSTFFSSFGGTRSSYSISSANWTPSPASDIYSMARVMQELLEPSSAHRFNRFTQIRKDESVESSENMSAIALIRPAIKKALSQDPSTRGVIGDLHTAVIRGFWTLQHLTSEVRYQGQSSLCRWFESSAIGENSTTITTTSSNSTSVSPYSTSTDTALQVEGQNISQSDKENRRMRVPNSLSVSGNASTQTKQSSIFKQPNGDRTASNSRSPFKEIRFNVSPGVSTAKYAEDTLSECPQPLTFSSPIQDPHQPIKSSESTKPVQKGLTKEEYIEMVAIPCEPLGPGRSRPQIRWRKLTAPAPLNSNSSSSSLNLETALSSKISAYSKETQRSLIDMSGNWIKTSSLPSREQTSRSKRIWSSFSKRFRREFKLMKSNKAPIKPASHLISPPMMLNSSTKNKRLLKLTGISPLSASFTFTSMSKATIDLGDTSDVSLPSPPEPPVQLHKERKEQCQTSIGESVDESLPPPPPPADIDSSWLVRKTIEDKKGNQPKLYEETKVSMNSHEMEKIRGEIELIHLKRTKNIGKTT